MITKAIILILIILCILWCLKQNSRVNRFHRNLKIGDTVAFYINEERYAGKVIEIAGTTIFISLNEVLYPRYIKEVYPFPW